MKTTMYQIEKRNTFDGPWKPIGPAFPSMIEAELAALEWLAGDTTRVVLLDVEITRRDP